MKRIWIATLALIVLNSCQNESKQKTDRDSSVTMTPPPPTQNSVDNDSLAPPLPPLKNVKSDSTAPPLEPPPPPKEDRSDEKTYDFASMKTPPTYPGGFWKFDYFLGRNIKYPQEALTNNVQGNVLVSFVVEKDGSLTNIKVERKLGSGTDEEAVRVLRKSIKWIPGMDNGKAVRAKYLFPIKFNLAN